MLEPSEPETLTVSELTARIKRLLEQSFAHVRILGEVSRLKRQPSGHIYFTIKDEGAAIGAVIWRSTAARLAAPPEEGKQYIFSGHLSLYPPQGRYQLVVTRLEPAGGGALAAEFERRKALFAKRGWFDPDRKRPLPALPRHIGIVTSPTAAALEDVKKVLAIRPGWLRLTLSPCLVQGAAAAPQIARAIKRLEAMPERPDVILLVRGGGSPEDLWCFNEEIVVRAIVECSIPIITGIGHEIDISLADLAADVHAATPSNAAELACPDRESLRRRLPRLALLGRLLAQTLAHARKREEHLRSHLHHAWQLIRDERRMHIERLRTRLHIAAADILKHRRAAVHALAARLRRHEPHEALRRRHQALDLLRQRLYASAAVIRHYRRMQLERKRQALALLPQPLIERERRRLAVQQNRLVALSPLSVLARGYALAQTPAGRLVTSAAMLRAGDPLAVRFHDGRADTHVDAVRMGPP